MITFEALVAWCTWTIADESASGLTESNWLLAMTAAALGFGGSDGDAMLCAAAYFLMNPGELAS